MSPFQLRCRREALGLSQQALAEALNVRQATVSRWESATSPIPEGVEIDLQGLETLLADRVAKATGAKVLKAHHGPDAVAVLERVAAGRVAAQTGQDVQAMP